MKYINNSYEKKNNHADAGDYVSGKHNTDNRSSITYYNTGKQKRGGNAYYFKAVV